jgi:hypothetical protein
MLYETEREYKKHRGLKEKGGEVRNGVDFPVSLPCGLLSTPPPKRSDLVIPFANALNLRYPCRNHVAAPVERASQRRAWAFLRAINGQWSAKPTLTRAAAGDDGAGSWAEELRGVPLEVLPR